MQNIEYRYVDKSGWGDGPWNDEPDKVQFVDEETGLPCLIVRGPRGALCGYVGVTADHPAFECDYYHVNVEVHGGLTFSSKCEPKEGGLGICHAVDEGEDDNVWWFGFDCSHWCDFIPGLDNYEAHIEADSAYRTIHFVMVQIESLARQLKAMSRTESAT